MPPRDHVISRFPSREDYFGDRFLPASEPNQVVNSNRLLIGERERLGGKCRQGATGRRSPNENRELSPRGPSSQVVAALAGKAKRRKRKLSALCVNWIVGCNSEI